MQTRPRRGPAAAVRLRVPHTPRSHLAALLCPPRGGERADSRKSQLAPRLCAGARRGVFGILDGHDVQLSESARRVVRHKGEAPRQEASVLPRVAERVDLLSTSPL